MNSAQWRGLRRRKLGPCRCCGKREPQHLVTLHHLVPKSLGGDDCDANVVPLCGTGTTGCHGLVENFDLVARSKLRASLLPPEVAYVEGKKGAAFLDRYYPLDYRPAGAVC